MDLLCGVNISYIGKVQNPENQFMNKRKKDSQVNDMLIKYTYISNLQLHYWIYRLQVQKLFDDSDIYVNITTHSTIKNEKGPESRFS